MFFKRIFEDIDSFFERDPAARSRLEVVLAYPGFHAVAFYRLSNWAWKRGFRVVGRFISHMGRVLTGIEIHPGATIGRRLFIDHGMGVVIGETAEVGDNVTLYQGVTLGGTSLNAGKRHPTVHDDVIVGSGAQVLGPIILSKGARVGANAVVLADVPAGMTVVGIPAKIVMSKEDRNNDKFRAYGMPEDKMPDPVARAMESLRGQMEEMMDRLDRLEGDAGRASSDLRPLPGGADSQTDDTSDHPSPATSRGK